MSIRDQKLYGEMARDAGAMGYVCKHEDIENISIAIRRVLDGKTYFDS